MKYVPDAIILAGFVAFTTGLWLVSEPVALCVSGALAMLAGVKVAGKVGGQ